MTYFTIKISDVAKQNNI